MGELLRIIPSDVLAQRLGRADKLRGEFGKVPPARRLQAARELGHLAHLLGQSAHVLVVHPSGQLPQPLLRQPKRTAQVADDTA